ncbi:MAG: MBL fold metallo-hydrolase [Theionarchaea archaeon DG-70]|nr:MAG: MBL fold metallo-hydrolase [Theionarchaea archaeon DG-70]
MKITIIYDNYPFDSRLKTEWGFSCFIEGLEKTLLFDTGGNGEILISNMQKLGIDPQSIDAVFLSHEHWDHTGGLGDFLELNQKAVVYLLPSFPQNIKKSIENTDNKYIEIANPANLYEKVASTGELGTAIKEQSLAIETDKGLVIITGCAHPGIVQIIETAKNNFEQNVYLVLGGFHLGGYGDNELKKIIQQFRKLDVRKAGPCHCSGDRCRELFKEEYKDDFVEIGVGKVILVNGK